MKVTIEGDRSEGKSTLALFIEGCLRAGTNYNVTREEEGAPDATLRMFKDEARKAAVDPPYYAFSNMFDPRNVEIVVKNP